MFKPLLLVAGALALAAPAPSGQSAYGIQIPVRGASDQPAGVVETPTVDEATGLDVVRAPSLSDAAAGAARQAAAPKEPQGSSRFKRIEGTSIFEDGEGGTGLMVVGAAPYSTSANPLAARLARRSAYVRAHADAMSTMTEKIHGADVEQRRAIVTRLSSAVTDGFTREEEDVRSDESIRASTSGLVRGAQVWKCEDDGETVRVWMFTMNESASGNRNVDASTRISIPDQYEAAVQSAMDEVLAGFLPPIGGKVVICPETERATYLGFGSAIITSTRAGGAAAGKKAKARAKVGLLSALQGIDVDLASELKGAEATLATDLQRLGDSLPSDDEDQRAADGVTATFSSTEEMREATELAVAGRIPPGTQDMAFVDEDNGWHTAVYAWTVGADDVLAALRGDAVRRRGSGSSPAATPAAADSGPAEGTPSEEVAATRAEAPPEPTDRCDRPAPEGHVRVLTVGEGSNRRIALKAALLEAVERVNGSEVSGSTAVKQQYRDAISDLNGKLSTAIESVSTVEEDIYTKANGMVRTYEVLSETEASGNGMTRLEVCSVIPVFDPTRPRPGRRPTIAVVPLGTEAQAFEVAGSNVPARTVADEITTEIVSGLVKLGSFTVLDRQHLEELEGEVDFLRKGLAAGTMEQAERIKLGHTLGADYIVVGDMIFLEHRLWKEYIPIRRKEEPRESLAIKSGCKLINVATGAIVDSDDFESSWGLLDLLPDRLQPYERGLSRQTLACRRAADSHLRILIGAMENLQRNQHPRLLTTIGTKQVVLKYAGSSYGIGDVLTVRGVVRVELDGEVEEIETEKGKVEITRVDVSKGHLYAKVLEGDSSSFEKGDLCRP
ncbi:CsgG/HfaB family protein [Planctomycetota bacterium]|nr:CsgG/HfaB family protein [Planctomycetota bacterium]